MVNVTGVLLYKSVMLFPVPSPERPGSDLQFYLIIYRTLLSIEIQYLYGTSEM